VAVGERVGDCATAMFAAANNVINKLMTILIMTPCSIQNA
jgi:hypothetical protein